MTTLLAIAATSIAFTLIPPVAARLRAQTAEEKQGGILLRYRGMRAFASFTTLVLPTAFAWILLSKQAPPLAAFIAAGFFLVGGLAISLEAYGTQLLLQRDGLVFRSFWRGLRRLKWAGVTSVRWVQSMNWFEIEGGALVHVSTMLEGVGWFAALVCDETRLYGVADPPTREVLTGMRAQFQQQLNESPEWQQLKADRERARGVEPH